MSKRLCDLVTLEENNKECAVLAVRDDVKPIDLIRLGGFDGAETMFRVTKGSSHSTITIFRSEGRPESIEVGSTTSRLSGSMRKARTEILECVGLDFGIFTRGEWHNGYNFDQMVDMTSGPRDLGSPRRFELYRTGGSCSLFVNNMHIAHIDYKNLDEWLADRNIRIEIQETKGFGADRTSVGRMVRASTPEPPEQQAEIAPAEPNAEQGDFESMLDKALDSFLARSDWQNLDPPSIAVELVAHAKREMNPSLEDLKEKARQKSSERNASRQPKTHRPDMER